MHGLDTEDLHELHWFWFGTLDAGFSDSYHRDRWFTVDQDFDAALAQQFGALPEAIRVATSGESLVLPVSSTLWLSCILATDQLPRNIWRGTARAFAFDSVALRLARVGIEHGLDQALTLDERGFFYMPFQHSENREDQDTSIELFSNLRDETPSGKRHLTGEYLRSAQTHRQIIMQFGRFPHRNAALGRANTQEEAAYFAKHPAGFGQIVSAVQT